MGSPNWKSQAKSRWDRLIAQLPAWRRGREHDWPMPMGWNSTSRSGNRVKGFQLGILAALTGVVSFSGDYPPEAVEAGKAQFADACSPCHGTNGEGGRGPSLVDGRAIRRAEDDELFKSIQQGVPGADMPPFPFSDGQVWNLVAFVRSLSAPAVKSNVEGDVTAGEAVFFGAGGCAKCHRIRGRGGLLGPDLSVIGSRRRIDQIRESLVDPNSRITAGFDAATLDGDVQAVVKNHTNFSAQVLDSSGRLHLLRGNDLARLRFEGKSWMAQDTASNLGDRQVRDLVAFLSRQASR